jgi:hypothetical protein
MSGQPIDMIFIHTIEFGFMENIQSILLSLKEQALDATKNADGKFYENYLAEDAKINSISANSHAVSL